MGKEDAGWGFVGKVPSDGFYGDYQGCRADKGAGYRFDASDGGLYWGIWEREGCDGVLGWDKNYIIYQDTRAHVIEVLTNKASNSYKDLLRKLGISYIIAGDTTLDYEVLLEKLKKLFNIELLMLGGGGVLNWSFIQEGLCDEVSVVMAASSDGSTKTPTLFMEKEGLSDDKPVHFKLEDVKIMEGDSLWLRYKIKK